MTPAVSKVKHTASAGSVVFDAANIAFLALLMLTMLYPFVYVVSVSISDYEAIAAGRVNLFPKGVHFEAYRALLQTQDIPRAFRNSVLFTVSGTLVTLFVASITAYCLEQPQLPYRRGLIVFFVLTMFIPGGMIPNFLLIKAIGFYNTIWAIILPPAFGAWNILIMRSNIRATVSRELMDAAYIDGASDFRIYATIVLPLIKPILATIALFAAVDRWNEFFAPLIYLSDASLYPLQIILRKILLANEVERMYDSARGVGEVISENTRVGIGFFEALKMATIIVAVWPILVVYPFVQRFFVKGILIGSLKA